MTARNLDKWTTIAATIGMNVVTCGMIYLGYYWIAAVTAMVSVMGAMMTGCSVDGEQMS